MKSVKGIISEPAATVVAAEQFIGDVDFAEIISGRAPVRATEVALAPLTLRSFDAQVGDSVMLADLNDPSRSFTFKVVGEVVVNDGLSTRPGKVPSSLTKLSTQWSKGP